MADDPSSQRLAVVPRIGTPKLQKRRLSSSPPPPPSLSRSSSSIALPLPPTTATTGAHPGPHKGHEGPSTSVPLTDPRLIPLSSSSSASSPSNCSTTGSTYDDRPTIPFMTHVNSIQGQKSSDDPPSKDQPHRKARSPEDDSGVSMNKEMEVGTHSVSETATGEDDDGAAAARENKRVRFELPNQDSTLNHEDDEIVGSRNFEEVEVLEGDEAAADNDTNVLSSTHDNIFHSNVPIQLIKRRLAQAPPEGASPIEEAIKDLLSVEMDVRVNGYTALLRNLESANQVHVPVASAMLEFVKELVAFFIRDLQINHPPALTDLALKCLGYYLAVPDIILKIQGWELKCIFRQVVQLSLQSRAKSTRTLAMWCVGTSRLAPKFPSIASELILLCVHNIEVVDNSNRVQSDVIRYYALWSLRKLFAQFPNETRLQADSWLTPVLRCLTSTTPGIRAAALDVTMPATRLLVNEDDSKSKRRLAVEEFLKEDFELFLNELRRSFLEASEELYAITAWSSVVVILGKSLHRHPQLMAFLEIAKTCFQPVNSRIDTKVATYSAWTRLIYNFAIDGYIFEENNLELVLAPIKWGLQREMHKRVRLAITNSWVSLVFTLGSRLPEFGSNLFTPIMKKVLKDKTDHVRHLALSTIPLLLSPMNKFGILQDSEFIENNAVSSFDLVRSNPQWVQTELLPLVFGALFAAMTNVYRVTDVDLERWRVSDALQLPRMTEVCARIWESAVAAESLLRSKVISEEQSKTESMLDIFIRKVEGAAPSQFLPPGWAELYQQQQQQIMAKESSGRVNEDIRSVAPKILHADIVQFLEDVKVASVVRV